MVYNVTQCYNTPPSPPTPLQYQLVTVSVSQNKVVGLSVADISGDGPVITDTLHTSLPQHKYSMCMFVALPNIVCTLFHTLVQLYTPNVIN